jgi:sulfite dehydrogenase
MAIWFRCLIAAHLGFCALLAPALVRAADEPDPALGKEVFLKLSDPPCAMCHTLADAGAAGKVGPSLDDLKPDVERVKAAIENGIGVMPPYEDMTAEQIAAVASYVAKATGGGQ